MKGLITCLVVFGLCASVSLADKPTLHQGPAQFTLPDTVQRVTPDFQRVGPVVNLKDSQGGIALSKVLAYDCFEPTPPYDFQAPPTDGSYGVNCGIPGQRYWFGFSYDAADYVDDMTVCPGGAGLLSDRSEFLWTWNSPGPADIYIFTTEDFDFSCVGPPYANVYDGVILTWNNLIQGFWYTDVDLTGQGFGWQMPMDGTGGIFHILSVGQSGTAIILAPLASPGLWGTKDPSATPPGTNCSKTSKIMWIDDNGNGSISDGVFDPATECYDMSGSQCPSPLGNCICLYGPCWPAHLRCDANCDGAFDSADIDPFFLGLADPELWEQTYYCCDFNIALDANADGSVDAADIDPFFAGLAIGHCSPQ